MINHASASEPSRPVLVSYEGGRGTRVGILVRQQVFDLADVSATPRYAEMSEVLGDWSLVKDLLRRFDASATNGTAPLALAEVRLLAPVGTPGAIYGAGANYADHAAEMARVNNTVVSGKRGERSWHFVKSSHSVVGPDAVVKLPEGASSVDWEVELAAVIGRQGKHLSLEEALDYVAAYAVSIDLSARDLSRRVDLPEKSPFRMDWLSHKSFDGACPIGPWLVPAEYVKDPQQLDLALSVNGETKQDSNTNQMIFSLAEQIRDLSARITLWPGDVVLTGTPAGVGSSHGHFLRKGDRVSASVAGLGVLEVSIEA